MSVDQLPARVREFVNYLDGLLARLDQGGGWCGVFWQRDPEGMRACLDGREVPPWDVVESLLHDLAGQYGPGGAGPETERARALHAAALAAYDSRPGGRDALGDRLDVMLREQRYAAERQAELGRSLAAATSQEEADTIRLDLAWARDDHERATARCAELRARMADLDRRAASERGQAIRRDRVGEGSVFRVDAGVEGGRLRDDGFGDLGSEDVASGAGRRQSSGTGSSGGGFPGVPHQRDARSAAQAPGRSEGRGAAPAGTAADRHEGRRAATSAAEAAEWRAARRRSGAGPVEGHGSVQGRPADPYAPGGIAGPSDWPDTPGAGADTDRPAAHPTLRTAPFGATAASDWPEVRHSADATPEDHAQAPFTAPGPAPTPKQRKRRRGSARFAGMVEEEATPLVVPPAAEPTLPAQPATTGRSPRGARFTGAAAERAVHTSPQPQAEPMDPAGRREVVGTVETLVRLRGEGRTGEAHVLLVEAAYWPAVRFPLLAAEMQRAGLGADWASLLWEAASLPAERLVAAADALTGAGRADDGEQILRQGVARPAHEIGQAVVGLVGEGRHREVRALLDACVRVRTPEEAARSAAPDPRTLVPLLLEAARGVSDERHWDLVHALRVAGFTA
ncbi:hypothetical protein QQM39_06235 [Streptomyces sp. DT2A-34]|uniref:hypothetical protein n=1 Tax=Streptomyces sp. DT2A-34 TaxID=3051182 RepID=UPI00265C4FE9|nr:hypothetical protein [Streptomyces sp. DT2A-34]MDO0910467.1 hypothetical protein [Streptomyces sp. DT2A-34]